MPTNDADVICTIETSGIEYSFRWDEFAIGANVFIPCLDTLRVFRQVQKSARKNGAEVAQRTGVRNGKWGIAIWRTL